MNVTARYDVRVRGVAQICRFAFIAFFVLVAANARAQSVADCNRAHEDERRAARSEIEGEMRACAGDRQCVAAGRAKMTAAFERIDHKSSACSARVRQAEAQAARAEPPPWAGWKPGDPSPRAKNGQLIMMSCSGRPLKTYKPGGAVALDIKSRPGNCIPDALIPPMQPRAQEGEGPNVRAERERREREREACWQERRSYCP